MSVQRLLDTLTRIQLELARKANPLTELPGNNMIEEELKSRFDSGNIFTKIYCDIDNFKSYNDKYGFKYGDKIILMTAKIIQGVVRKYGSKTDFVGHIGGDDFIIITSSDSVDEMCKRIIKMFDRLTPRKYDSLARERGGVEGKDRKGMEKWFPFITISLSVVECGGDKTASINEAAQLSADLKRYAKSIIGSVYVKNRRQ